MWSHHSVVVPAIGLLLISTAGTAVAQSAKKLDEVVVTAERRETNLQDTPIAITAVNADDILKLGVQDTRELAKFIPNLTITPSFAYGNSQPSTTIRGVGAGSLPSFGITTDPSVAIYIDGMYYGRNPGSILSLAETQQVEVLRGPQGTLFGRNTTGGAISYKTYKASPDALKGYVDLAAGSFNERNIKAGINIPLSDTWAMRAAVADLNRDGLLTRGDVDYGGVNSTVARLAFHGDPADNLSFDASLSYTKSDTNGEAQDWVAYKINPGGEVGTQVLALSLALQAMGKPAIVEDDPRLIMDDTHLPNYCLLDDANPFTQSPACATFRHFNMTVGTFKGTYDLNDHVTFGAFSGFLNGDSDNQNDFIMLGTEARRFTQGFSSFQQEFQVNMTYDRVKAVAGLIYYTEDATEHEITREATIRGGNNPFEIEKARVLAGIPLTRRNESYGQHTQSTAMYGQATYAATKKLDVTAGVRYTRDKKEGWIQYLPTKIWDPRGPALVRGDRHWDASDYKLSLQYHFNDDVMLYLSDSKAYKAGVMNDGSLETTIGSDNPSLGWTDPEDVVSKEIGIRSEWFDHRLRVNATYFDMVWGNRTGTDVVNDELGQPTFQSVNEPNITSSGYELMTTVALTDSLTLIGSYSTNKARQEDNPNFVLSGNSEQAWSLRLRHEHDFANGGSLSSSLNYAHTGKTVTFNVEENEDDDPNINPGYAFTSGRISYAPANGKWSLSLYGKNLLDEEIVYGRWSLGFFYGGNGTEPQQQYTALPRTFGLEYRYNFF